MSGHSVLMTLRWQCLNIDSHDPSADAVFWEQALGWRRTYDHDDEVVLGDDAVKADKLAPVDVVGV